MVARYTHKPEIEISLSTFKGQYSRAKASGLGQGQANLQVDDAFWKELVAEHDAEGKLHFTRANQNGLFVAQEG